MMSSALGVLRWTPETFRKSTIYEYTSAMKGLIVSKGGTAPVTKAEVDEAWSEHKERMKASGIGH